MCYVASEKKNDILWQHYFYFQFEYFLHYYEQKVLYYTLFASPLFFYG